MSRIPLRSDEVAAPAFRATRLTAPLVVEVTSHEELQAWQRGLALFRDAVEKAAKASALVGDVATSARYLAETEWLDQAVAPKVRLQQELELIQATGND